MSKKEGEVAYQPIVNHSGEVVVGVEALCRWTHPVRGEIQPSEFIPIAENSGLIIALGESIVVTGATFADLAWSTETVAAFASAFDGALAMWWIYFHRGAEAGSELISRSSEPGRLARLAYTYLHMPIVAGIILSAVADELVLKHPADHSDLKTVLSDFFSSPTASASFRWRYSHGSPADCHR